MAHRHTFNAAQIRETDSDPGRNQTDQTHMPIARGASEMGSAIPTVNNITGQSGHFLSQWTPAPPRSNGYSPSIINGELLRYQSIAPGPSHDPFLHQSGGNLHMLQDYYSHHSSSSNIVGQTVPGVGGGLYNHTVGSTRGTGKRKSPSIPPAHDMGSSSRYNHAGSSADICSTVSQWQEKQNTDLYHTHWDNRSSYEVNSLSMGEGTLRNVRSRSAVDLETNLARTRLSGNSLHHSLSGQSSGQSNLDYPVDFWGQTSNVPTREWNRNPISPAGHGMTHGSDSSFFIHDLNSLNMLSCHYNGSLEMGGQSNCPTSSSNPAPQNVSSHLNQLRGVGNNYAQRSVLTFGASSSNFRPEHVAASDEGQQMVTDCYPSRHARAFSRFRLRNMDSNGRNFMSSETFRPFTGEASVSGRLMPEGLTAVNHPAFYGSRTLLDQHRDMRLDIDNMSYEELLALGERIGTVSTGLSDDIITECLTKTIYCSSNSIQDEGTCVICLEEYGDLDDVGSLKACGHDFHVGCIRKWLSLKNLCPICKASAADESVKEK